MKAIILAAGEGKRMQSETPKVLHKIGGREMLRHVIDAARGAGAQQVVVVVGKAGSAVKDAVRDSGVSFAEQAQQLGTGHAVQCAGDFIEDTDQILVLCGDAPLVTPATLIELEKCHNTEKNAVTVLSTVVDNPQGYGRIIKDETGFLKIVEQRDADDTQRQIKEINTGVYLFEAARLRHALKSLKNNNAAAEYYLTDTVELIKKLGHKAGVYRSDTPEEFLGVNSREQLADVAAIMRRRINTAHMAAGVGILDPAQVYIDCGVTIGRETFIYPGAIIEGDTKIGRNCVIGPGCRIVHSEIGDSVNIQYSVVLNSTVGDYGEVGPYAYIRPGSRVGKNCKVGDFVEVKNSVIGDSTKVSHLSYIGDTDVGSGVNVGCGTVTVNYDAKSKYRTTIRDGAFIGCNTNLIAPVTVGAGAYIAAGSTITDDVPEDALAIARARQVNKPGGAVKYRS